MIGVELQKIYRLWVADQRDDEIARMTLRSGLKGAEHVAGQPSPVRSSISLENLIHFRVHCIIDASTSLVSGKPGQRPADADPKGYREPPSRGGPIL